VTNESEDEPFDPAKWLSASETIRRVRTTTDSPYSRMTIAKRAHAGMVRTRAKLFIVGEGQFNDTELPPQFWWAEGGNAMEQNWETGDFAISRPQRARAFGVTFHIDGLREMIPSAFEEVQPAVEPSPRQGGRKMSERWPQWVAELAAMIHEEGFPDGSIGSDVVIRRIEERLADKGLEGPPRTTVQPTVRAVLSRLRGAGN
jgi:hypothetical protein